MSSAIDPTLGYATEAGPGRGSNQDKLGFYRPDDADLAELAGSVYVVVDGGDAGPGGAGRAEQAVRQIVRAYYAAAREGGRPEALAAALSAADRALRPEGADPAVDAPTGGVHAAVAVLCNDTLIVGHVGRRARVHLVRAGQAYRLTEDPSDATASLGWGPAPRPVCSEAIPLGGGDRIVLSTDGCFGALDEARLGPAALGLPPEAAAARLLSLARAADGAAGDATALVVAPYDQPVRTPAAPPATLPTFEVPQISWPSLAIGAGTLLTLAGLMVFWPDIARALGERGSAPAGQVAEALVTAAPPTEAPTAALTAEPSASPTPEASVTATTPARVTVPSVVGLSQADAEQVVRANDLQLGLIRQYSGTVDPGIVISQSPRPGEQMEPGQTVQIAISLGPALATPTRYAPRILPTAPPTLAPASPAAPTADLPTDAPPLATEEEDDPSDPRPRPTDEPAPTDEPEPTEEPKEDPPTPKPAPPKPDAWRPAPGGPRLARSGGRLSPGLAAPIWAPRAARPQAAPLGPVGRPAAPQARPRPQARLQSEPSAWLGRLNAFRGLAGLFGVNEAPDWSRGASAHARYVGLTGQVTREEDPGVPEHTPEGAAAGPGSLILADARAERAPETAIDEWTANAFDLVRLIDPRLTVVGFGHHAQVGAPKPFAAVLDVTRGRQPSLPAGARFPVRYPAPNQLVEVVRYQWTANNPSPNPLTGCPGLGAGAVTGPAIAVLLGEGARDPKVTASSFTASGKASAHCVLTEGTYVNPDAGLQAWGRAILGASDAVVIIPHEPLRFGREYGVSLTVDGGSYSWTFRADKNAGPTLTPQLPPPTDTPTPTATATATATPTDTPTPTPSPTNTSSPTPTPSPTATFTATPTPTPRPAYLPLLLLEKMLYCELPWPGIDDPEPDAPNLDRDDRILCPDVRYGGRLWASTGGTDDDDWYSILVRRPGDIQIDLEVPKRGNNRLDYDLFVYRDPSARSIAESRLRTFQDESIVLSVAEPGRYWIRVWAQGRQVEAPYHLRWSRLQVGLR